MPLPPHLQKYSDLLDDIVEVLLRGDESEKNEKPAAIGGQIDEHHTLSTPE
jgi:hypothetical protein